MHHKRVDSAGPGDNVGMNIKGLDKGNMPRAGDVMIMKSDASLKHVEDFTAQIQVRIFCFASCTSVEWLFSWHASVLHLEQI